MNNLLLRDKKGVSEIVGYVLLIVIAIAISITVYAFLREQVPEDATACRDDVHLAIEDISCKDHTLNITLGNRGLFDVQGVYIKSGAQGSVYKIILNCLTENTCVLNPGSEIAPGDTWNVRFTNETLINDQEIEIQPLTLVDGKGVLCDKAIVKQIINCPISDH